MGFNGIKIAEHTTVPRTVNDISLVFDTAANADTIEGAENALPLMDIYKKIIYQE